MPTGSPHEWLRVESLTTLPPCHVPLALRDSDDGDYTSSAIIVKGFGDPATDPRSGGIVGWPQLQEAYRRFLQRDLSDRQIRTLVGRGGYVRFVGRCPGTNQKSVENHCVAHVASVTASPRNAALVRWERLETLAR